MPEENLFSQFKGINRFTLFALFDLFKLAG